VAWPPGAEAAHHPPAAGVTLTLAAGTARLVGGPTFFALAATGAGVDRVHTFRESAGNFAHFRVPLIARKSPLTCEDVPKTLGFDSRQLHDKNAGHDE
jgi:hypothetical protein